MDRAPLVSFGNTNLMLPPGAEAAVAELAATETLESILQVDLNGLIVAFTPTPGMKWQQIFFVQNLMLTQRTYLVDRFLKQQGVIL